jgi:hypothetical protein
VSRDILWCNSCLSRLLCFRKSNTLSLMIFSHFVDVMFHEMLTSSFWCCLFCCKVDDTSERRVSLQIVFWLLFHFRVV